MPSQADFRLTPFIPKTTLASPGALRGLAPPWAFAKDHQMKKPAHQHPKPLACKVCGKFGVPKLTWQVFRTGDIHLRADCGTCGRYLGYAPQTPENVSAAPPMPQQ